MADIELVIKIPESTYKVFKNLSKIIGVLVYEKDILTLIKAVKNGTPLPKGHGRLRLIEEDKLDECKEIMTDISGENDYAIRMYHIRNWSTIIEADREGE